jgi:hypothetical protein
MDDYQVSYAKLQSMFDTSTLQSGESIEIL